MIFGDRVKKHFSSLYQETGGEDSTVDHKDDDSNKNTDRNTDKNDDRNYDRNYDRGDKNNCTNTNDAYKVCVYYSNCDSGRIKVSDEWGDEELPMESVFGGGKKVHGCLEQLQQVKKKFGEIKVLFSVGGWGTAHCFQAIAGDERKMDNFVGSCVEYTVKFGFDGVDIDWEYPENEDEARVLVELLKRIRRAFDQVGGQFLVTVASPAGEEQVSKLKLAEMDRYLSFWNVMCYDYNGQGWSSRTGFHSNLFGENGDNSLHGAGVIDMYLRAGIASQKLVLGMPSYGRCFFGAKSGSIGVNFKKRDGEDIDIIDYKKLPLSGTKEEWDPRKVSAYCYDRKLQKFVCYDNPQSARVKAQYVSLKRLGGGMWWDTAGDSSDKERSLVMNFVDQLGGVRVLDKRG